MPETDETIIDTIERARQAQQDHERRTDVQLEIEDGEEFFNEDLDNESEFG